ncbi:MAG: YtxH domain-containing protein [Chloroflexi bacterium]|nr:YtxH domain-containing protein [Chloroflexota bacterium]
MTIRFVFGLIIGLLVGASFALAIAPQGGAATRRQLWDKAADRVGRGGGG